MLAVGYGVLLVVPAAIAIVGPLKSNGSFVRLVGLLSFFLVLAAVLRWKETRTVRPAAALLVGYLALHLFSWGLSFRHGVGAGGIATLNRALLLTTSAVGLALLCTMVVRSVRQAHVLAGLLVGGAAFSAVIGILQGLNVIDRLAPYFLTPITAAVVEKGAITSRGDLARVSGTATHPIEYAVILAMMLPLAIHLLLHARVRRSRLWAGVGCGTILLGFPFGVSRAGLLTLVVALLVYGAYLRGSQRVGLLLAVGVALTSAMVVAPAVVSTFAQSIIGAEEDNSITGRLDDYPLLFARFEQAPWLGGAPVDVRQIATVTDNQWLLTLVGSGIFGVATLALLFGGGVLMAMSAARRPAVTPAERSLHGAIGAAVAGAALAAGTFDLLSFQQVTFLIFALIALIGVRSHTGPHLT
ncbi:O-antigen ligase family protein [Modestobacter sp. VKM Ac-2984]|uniref:O-antigen ligase family protein n=1 Tax=Modestobacter sp. VKM Ac-2984 TaxID=3004138 RepID=UPI0022AA19EB|nr:O-antigen ligase family protein [Modestobacter sp. VKM Ac-2984]MCZ2817353.1 hypothetical protein [Modestobacter sp. VKM Ac-2984]